MDWHGYGLDQVETWADRIVEAAWEQRLRVRRVRARRARHRDARVARAGRAGRPRAAARSRSCCASGCSATAGTAGRTSAATGMHRVEEGRMLIALRDNPRPSRQAKWPLVPPPLHGDPRMTPHRGRDLRARVPAVHHVDQRRLHPDGHAARPQRRAGVVLGLHEPQLDPRAPVPARVAQPLRGPRPEGDRRPLARSSSSAGTPQRVEEAAAAPRGPVPHRRRLRLRDLAAVRDRGVAVAVPLGPARHAAPPPLRRGRIPRDRAGDPGGAARDRRRPRAPRADAAAAPHRRAGRARRAPHARTSTSSRTAPAARSARASSSASATPARAPRPCSTATAASRSC